MGDGKDDIENARGDTRHFAAFISYSHADTAMAAKLQRKLERYRLPKRLATHGGRAQALGAVFRDREDLAAATSLSAAIREALARSDAVIVLCSPDAAKSSYVAAEIELFRELHPHKPILAALIAGEPAVSFPPALTVAGYEPLAADLRPEGDGPLLGFLKIVAGIAGVPLDALIQRDAQRRIRRVTAITAGALAAMLVMGIMTVYAISARNEAARQRSAAEGLVEYMLTDLREKLRGVGRLDVMDAVNVRAMEHYAAQGDLRALPDDSLERRTRILHAMGEDDDRNGDLPDALKKFREAHRTTAALLHRDPKNPERIFAHAQSEYWVGYASWRHNDYKSTQRHWQAYLDHAGALARVEPKSARSHMELGYANGNMCELLIREEPTEKLGLEHCRKAIAFERRALQIEPDNEKYAMDLANRLGWMADALERVGSYDSAISYREAEQRVIDRLAARDPKNVELRVRRTWPQIGLGKIAESRKQTEKAAAILKDVAKTLEQISAEFPEDIHTLEFQIRTQIILARVYRAAGRSEWRTHRDRAAVLIERVADANAEGQPRLAAMLAKFDGRK